MNIFEGARRTSILLGGVAAVITVLVAFNTNSYYQAHYSLAAPNAPFIKTDSSCENQGHRLYFDYKTSNSKVISVTICIESMPFTTANKEVVHLIPYKVDADGMTWGKERYSNEVSTYEGQIKKRFTMSTTDEEVSIEEADKHWRSTFVETMRFLTAGLAIFGTLVWAIGWIVRGFMGIPRGQDQKPPK